MSVEKDFLNKTQKGLIINKKIDHSNHIQIQNLHFLKGTIKRVRRQAAERERRYLQFKQPTEDWDPENQKHP